MISIRPYQVEDAAALQRLFHDTVMTVNRQDYTQAQVEAWAAGALDQQWIDCLSQGFTAIALIDDQIVGFAELKASGYIDRFFCHRDFQGQGVGTQLLNCLEAEAKQQKITQLLTEASITAKPFFQQRGFAVVRSQQVERRGQIFTNFVMTKSLSC